MADLGQISVVIAEDEPVILHNITKKVENAASCFHVVKEAANGLEVMTLLEKETPDILITDIEMPGMNGLELIAEVTLRFPSVHIIILSGYNNFEYARTAMRYGVKEYLLKPVVQNDLTAVLLKLAGQIEKERRNLERNILSRAISHVKEEELSPACFSGKSFLLSLITLGNLPSRYVQPRYNPHLPALWDNIDFSACFKNMSYISHFWVIDESCCLQKFLILHGDQKKLSADRINSALYQYLTAIPEDTPFHIVTAGEAISYQDIWSLAKQIREYTAQTTLLHSRDHSICSPKANYSAPDYKKLKAETDFLYQITSSGELIKYLSESLHRYEENRVPQQYAENFIYQCCRTLPLLFPVEETMCCAAMNHILSALHESADIDGLCNQIKTTLSELFLNHSAETNADSLPPKIRQYIDGHYRQEITAETLSRHFGYTPSYINRIFKKESGITPLQYVTSLRMEHAKELLLQDIDIKKIAAVTGYEDARYFSRVFKNETGLTPSVWARQKKEEPETE